MTSFWFLVCLGLLSPEFEDVGEFLGLQKTARFRSATWNCLLLVVIIQNNMRIESNQCHIMSPSHEHLFSCLQVSCIKISFVTQEINRQNELITCIKGPVSIDCTRFILQFKSFQNAMSWPRGKKKTQHGKTLQTIPTYTTSPPKKTWHIIIFHKSSKYNSVWGISWLFANLWFQHVSCFLRHIFFFVHHQGCKKNLTGCKQHAILVGGFNPFEKYARRIGSFPPGFGVKIKNIGVATI